MLKTIAMLLLASSAAAADVYRFPAAGGHMETSGDGCSGYVIKEVTRAIADAVPDGLTIELDRDKGLFEVVKALSPNGEKRMRAPKVTGGGEVGIWSSAAKTGPGDVTTVITIGDVVPCDPDPLATPHGCRELKLDHLGARHGAALGVTVSLGYGNCTARWTSVRGERGAR
jgi:hypothetical protein